MLFGALHQAVPERMPAAYYAVSYVVTFQTIDPELGRKVLVEIEIGGCGALPYSDGASAHSFGMHNNANIPMEMIESDMPLTFLGYGLLPDSGGAGPAARRPRPVARVAHRLPGGAALDQSRPLQVPPLRPGRRRAAASLSALYLIRDGVRQALPSKVTNLMLRKGDIVRLETSGGGGFGEAAPAPARAGGARRAPGVCHPRGRARRLRTGLSRPTAINTPASSARCT